MIKYICFTGYFEKFGKNTYIYINFFFKNGREKIEKVNRNFRNIRKSHVDFRILKNSLVHIFSFFSL